MTDNNGEITIQDNIPIPTDHSAGRRRKYPAAILEIGQSFFVPLGSIKETSLSVMAGGLSRRYKPKRFIGRTVTENGVRGHRIWRIEDAKGT